MKVSEEFYEAIQDPALVLLYIVRDGGKEFIRLAAETGNLDGTIYERATTPTSVKVINWYNFWAEDLTDEQRNAMAAYIEYVLNIPKSRLGHVITFLNAITPESDVSFEVMAYAPTNLEAVIKHTLYGHIDGRSYLLAIEYYSEQTTDQPVRPKK